MADPFGGMASPSLVVDVARLDRNVADMAARMADAGVRLRPHFKTSKCLEVARRQLAAGAIGFTCSTPAEVRLLQDEGVDDLLWAHQPVGPVKVAFAVEALRRGGLMVALDSVEAAEPLARAAADTGVAVPYLMECDTGLHRAGVDPDRAVATAAALAALPALELRGVMTHEGHVGKHAGDRAAVEAAGTAAGKLLAEIAGGLRDAGHASPIVSVGSTPAATSSPVVDGVTEARPGTYVYYDANQIGNGSATTETCAQTVLARVVSTQRAGRAIIDAGSKSMSSDGNPTAGGLGLVCDLDVRPRDGIKFAAANEEHGYLTGPGTADLAVGELLRIIPNHACTATNMWSRAYGVHPDGATETWEIRARH
jgi:D-serine deaminase-like pyridoxal phosphate-dependent protein